MRWMENGTTVINGKFIFRMMSLPHRACSDKMNWNGDIYLA
jgi:hypothetical protein